MRPAPLILLVLLTLLPGCAATGGRAGAAAGGRDNAAPRAAVVGLASWVSSRYDGHATASGKPYDERRLTAAHRTLPFGTRVRVTTLAGGRSVVVTITDRGPFRGGRIIDVSKRAARELGFLSQGTARVRLEVLPARDGSDAAAAE